MKYSQLYLLIPPFRAAVCQLFSVNPQIGNTNATGNAAPSRTQWIRYSATLWQWNLVHYGDFTRCCTRK